MFDAAFFRGNRQRLIMQLAKNSFMILTAHGQMQRSDDSAFPFDQEANFWYLTGVDEAHWWLIVDTDTSEEYLVAPQRQEYQRVFDGSLSATEASKQSGVARVLDRVAGRKLLKDLLVRKQTVHTLKPRPRQQYGFYTNRAQYDLLHQMRGAAIEDMRPTLARQRAIKQPVEIAAMRKAIEITGETLAIVARKLPELQHEYEAEALLSYEFRRRGSEGHAFEPIVASGKNACTLHYLRNNQPLQPHSLLVMDVGARVRHYPADITRTFAIGEPTERQRAVFAAVQRVHDGAIALCRPDMSTKDYTHETERLMGAELVALGLLKRADDRAGVYRWMPHAISHGLGVEVHDSLGRPEYFQAGMVLTVEPGIYLPDEGIGVRIEDDILITADGPEVLSGSIPSRLA